MILNIDKPDPRFADYMSYPIEDLDKTFTQIISENLSTTETEKAILTGFVSTLISVPNPDFVQEDYDADPDNYAIPETIAYIPTIREFANLMNDTIGQKFSNGGNEYHVLKLPPLEDIVVVVEGYNERDTIKLFGKGKSKPIYTLWSSPRNKEFKNTLTPVSDEI